MNEPHSGPEQAVGTKARGGALLPWLWLALGLGVAVAVGVAVARFGPRETAWRLQEVRGGSLTWAGVSYVLADSNGLREAIRRGGSFGVPEGTELVFVHPGDVAITFAAGATGQLTPPPRRLSAGQGSRPHRPARPPVRGPARRAAPDAGR